MGRADTFHGIEIRMVEILAAAEHQVLKQVRKTCFARLLIFRTDVILSIYWDDGRFMVLMHKDRQPIFQNELRVLDVGNWNVNFAWRSMCGRFWLGCRLC